MRIAVLVVVVGAALLVGGLALAGVPGTLGSVGVGLALAGIAGLGVLLVYSDVTAARDGARGAATRGRPGGDTLQSEDRKG